MENDYSTEDCGEDEEMELDGEKIAIVSHLSQKRPTQLNMSKYRWLAQSWAVSSSWGSLSCCRSDQPFLLTRDSRAF